MTQTSHHAGAHPSPRPTGIICKVSRVGRPGDARGAHPGRRGPDRPPCDVIIGAYMARTPPRRLVRPTRRASHAVTLSPCRGPRRPRGRGSRRGRGVYRRRGIVTFSAAPTVVNAQPTHDTIATRRMPRPPPRAPHMCARSSLHRAADTRVVCHVHRNRPPMDAPNSTNDNAASTRDPTAEFSTAAREYRHQTRRTSVPARPRAEIASSRRHGRRCTSYSCTLHDSFLFPDREPWSMWSLPSFSCLG